MSLSRPLCKLPALRGGAVTAVEHVADEDAARQRVQLVAPVLAFHHLSDALDDYTSYPPRRFLRLVGLLAREGMRFVTAATAVSSPSERQVVVTFDDGYLSIRDTLVEATAEHGMLATVFPIVGAVGGPNDWNRKCDYWCEHMSWDDLARLASAGHEIGNHTMSHHALPKLPADVRAREVDQARDRIREVLGVAVDTFAYPFGKHDAATREVVARSHRQAFTTETKPGGRSLAQDRAALSRVVATRARRPEELVAMVIERTQAGSAVCPG